MHLSLIRKNIFLWIRQISCKIKSFVRGEEIKIGLVYILIFPQTNQVSHNVAYDVAFFIWFFFRVVKFTVAKMRDWSGTVCQETQDFSRNPTHLKAFDLYCTIIVLQIWPDRKSTCIMVLLSNGIKQNKYYLSLLRVVVEWHVLCAKNIRQVK